MNGRATLKKIQGRQGHRRSRQRDRRVCRVEGKSSQLGGRRPKVVGVYNSAVFGDDAQWSVNLGERANPFEHATFENEAELQLIVPVMRVARASPGRCLRQR